MKKSNTNIVDKIKSALSGETFVYIDAHPDNQFKKHLKHPDIRAAISKLSHRRQSVN